MLLHTKYQGSRPCGFRQEDFFMFLLIKAYVKPVTPPYNKSLCKASLGRGHFWPPGSNLNKLGRGPPDDASYQVSRL